MDLIKFIYSQQFDLEDEEGSGSSGGGVTTEPDPGAGGGSDDGGGGTNPPFTKIVTVTGILATDNPIIDLDLSNVAFANIAAIQEAWGKIYRAVTGTNTITFYSTEALTVELKFNAKVVR
jgi:hypothetical protein